MKLFGRKEEVVTTNLSDPEKKLLLAINSVTAAQHINSITNELEAEKVLSELLEGFGYQLETRLLRVHDFTIEQNQQQIIRMVDEVHELLTSSLSSPALQAALSSFVFNAGVAYDANPSMVASAFATMLETDSSKSYLSLDDTDSLFVGQLTKFVLGLDASEAKTFIAELRKGSVGHAPQLNTVFDKLEIASEVQQAKSNKEAVKVAEKSSGAKSSLPTSSPKFCGYCGNSLNPGAKFCGSCGSPITIR